MAKVKFTYTNDSLTYLDNYYIINNVVDDKYSNEFVFKLIDIDSEIVVKFIEETFKEYILVYIEYGAHFNKKLLYKFKDSLIKVNTHTDCVYVSICNFDDKKYLEVIKEFYEKHKSEEVYRGKVFALTQGQFGLEEVQLANKFPLFEKENYSEEQIEAFNHISYDFTNPDPCGRLVILDGAPGTGKSYFVKGLISVTEAMFLIIPSNMIQSLDSPGLLSYFISLRERFNSDKKLPIVLVVEDADECLLPRDGMNMSSVSTLLNLGDGLLGSALDVRILCTTNAKSIEIDKALVRPGRLCAQVSIGSLTPEKCAIIYTRLTGEIKEFKDKLTLSEVYALANTNKLDNNGSKSKDKDNNFGFI